MEKNKVELISKIFVGIGVAACTTVLLYETINKKEVVSLAPSCKLAFKLYESISFNKYGNRHMPNTMIDKGIVQVKGINYRYCEADLDAINEEGRRWNMGVSKIKVHWDPEEEGRYRISYSDI